jgi:hypothetical protein
VTNVDVMSTKPPQVLPFTLEEVVKIIDEQGLSDGDEKHLWADLVVEDCTKTSWPSATNNRLKGECLNVVPHGFFDEEQAEPNYTYCAKSVAEAREKLGQFCRRKNILVIDGTKNWSTG